MGSFSFESRARGTPPPAALPPWLVLCLFFQVWANVAGAQEDPTLISTEAEERLQEISLAVRRESVALSKYEAEVARLQKEREALEREIVGIKKAQQVLENEERESMAELERLREEHERTLLREQELRALSRKRLRAMYQFQPQRVNSALLSALMTSASGTNSVDTLTPPQANYLLARLRSTDQSMLAQLGEALSQQHTRSKELSARSDQLASLKAQKQAKAQALHAERSKLQSLLKLSAQRKAEAEGRVMSLQAESLRLEQVLVSLMADEPRRLSASELADARAALGTADSEVIEGLAGAYDGSIEPVKRLSRSAPSSGASLPRSSEVGPGKSGSIDRRPFDGPGIRAQRKQLTVPVRGTVVRGFGKQRHKEFSDLVFQRGIEVLVRKDLFVRAIAPGRVLFVGSLPGYGTVVLIDHGQRSHSLYGRLGPVEVAPGLDVERGQEIASLEPADRRGSNFYFEVRENSAPVNPRVFFPNL